VVKLPELEALVVKWQVHGVSRTSLLFRGCVSGKSTEGITMVVVLSSYRSVFMSHWDRKRRTETALKTLERRVSLHSKMNTSAPSPREAACTPATELRATFSGAARAHRPDPRRSLREAVRGLSFKSS